MTLSSFVVYNVVFFCVVFRASSVHPERASGLPDLVPAVHLQAGVRREQPPGGRRRPGQGQPADGYTPSLVTT